VGTSAASSARSECSWDGQHLVCRTSDCGYIPVYYCTDAAKLLAAGSLQQCLAQCRDKTPDWPSVVLALVLGHYVEGWTCFSDIRALPLSCDLDWSANTGPLLTERRLPPSNSSIEPEQALAEYNVRLGSILAGTQHSTERALGLSGGRDSRHILFWLARLKSPIPRLITSHHYLGPASARDVEVARLAAGRLGEAVEEVQPLRDRFVAEWRKNRILELQSLSHSWGLALGEAVGDVPVLFDGMNGGVLFGRSAPVRFLRSEWGETLPDWPRLKAGALRFLFDKPVAMLDGLVARRIFSPEHVAAARDRLEASLEKYAGYPNPLQAFLYYNHVSRDTSAFTYELMKARAVACPLDDPELVSWSLGLPWRISSDPTLQTRAIRAAFPEFADLPFEDELGGQRPGFELDAAAEIASLRALLGLDHEPVVTEAGAKLLLSGQATLQQIQVFTYLTQLMEMCKSGRLEAFPGQGPS
jgi:asparagine synthase (glutamine-hydrolysing)